MIHILIQPGRAKNTFKRLHCGVDHYLYPRVFDVNFTDLKHFISIALMVARQEAVTQMKREFQSEDGIFKHMGDKIMKIKIDVMFSLQ